MADVLPESPLSTEVKSLRDRARNISEQLKAGMLQQKDAKNAAERISAELDRHIGASPRFDELMRMTPEEIKANQAQPKREAAPEAGEASTPNKQSLKETGNQQEKRLFAEDRAGGRPAQSDEYHAYEGKTSGSFRQWAQRLQSHINRAFRGGANQPQLDTARLAKRAPEGAPPTAAEGTAAFIERHPQLRAGFDKLRLSIDSQLVELQTKRSAAKGDRAALRSLGNVEKEVVARRDELSRIERGLIGDLRPDLVEVFFSEQRAIVTDITQKTGDPLHNFKTALYVEIVKGVLGWTDVHGVNFNNVFDQNVTP